jgi:hypothetical protein
VAISAKELTNPVSILKKVTHEDDDIKISIDSDGIKVTKRDQWTYDKYPTSKNRKKVIKIRIAVDMKQKKNPCARGC